jgi:hypothetical protein
VKRISIALLSMIVGLAIAFMPSVLAPYGCRETCPDWFAMSSLACMVLTPVMWFAIGWRVAGAPRRQLRRNIALLAVVALSVCASIGIAVLSNHFQQVKAYGSMVR